MEYTTSWRNHQPISFKKNGVLIDFEQLRLSKITAIFIAIF
jgi:hypothetical protein